MLNLTHNTLKIALATAIMTFGFAQAQESVGVEPFRFKVPNNYIPRLFGTELTASNESGFGFRNFSLPLDLDIRISLVKNAKYWEYNMNTRMDDTTYAFGIFNNGYTASFGIPKLEIRHDPWKGFQGTADIQHFAGTLLPDSGYDSFSKATVGYAFTVWDGRIRILNNLGIGYKSFKDDTTAAVTSVVTAPYTESIVAGGYSEPLDTTMTARLNAAARLYTFPVQKQLQASLDLLPGIEFKPISGVLIDLAHLERFVTGEVAIDNFNLARYQESYATIAYKFPSTPDFGIGMLRTRVTRNWTGDYTYVRNDVLFNFNELPILVGPSIGYQFGPSKDGSNSGFLFSFSVAGK